MLKTLHHSSTERACVLRTHVSRTDEGTSSVPVELLHMPRTVHYIYVTRHILHRTEGDSCQTKD